ncbi:hypothetical protein [Thermoclostridium stercorarium]|jgi:hypothetical protein|nr:hypothetical protein [Thermoclostridium stercorarium]
MAKNTAIKLEDVTKQYTIIEKREGLKGYKKLLLCLDSDIEGVF